MLNAESWGIAISFIAVLGTAALGVAAFLRFADPPLTVSQLLYAGNRHRGGIR
jgi:hypothetical protein